MRIQLSRANTHFRSGKSTRRLESIYGFCTAFIPLLGFILFSTIPMVISIINSYQEYGGQGSPYEISNTIFVGWDNFVKVLKDPIFYKAIGNTLLNCLVTPLCMAVGLIIALIVSNTKLLGRNFFKALFFIPYVCSVVASCLVWVCLMEEGYGPLHQFLTSIGLGWISLNNSDTVMPIMIFLGVWSGSGFSVIMYCAALTNTDNGIIEASKIDGANAWQRFKSVTLPSIMPVTFFLLITGIIGNLQDFTRFSLVGGYDATDNAYVTVAYYLYHYIDGDTLDLGLACATSWILMIMIMTITITQFVINRKQGDQTR